MQFSSIWPIDSALFSTTIPGQSEPKSGGNKEVLHISQSSSITGTSPSDCLVPYPRHLLGWGFLPLCRVAVGVFYSPSPLSMFMFLFNVVICWVNWKLKNVCIQMNTLEVLELQKRIYKNKHSSPLTWSPCVVVVFAKV